MSHWHLMIGFFFMWKLHTIITLKWKQKILQELVTYQCHASLFAQSFDYSLVSEWFVNNKSERWLCKTADLSQEPAQKRGVCSDSNLTAQPLQMAGSKGFEMISGMIDSE